MKITLILVVVFLAGLLLYGVMILNPPSGVNSFPQYDTAGETSNESSDTAVYGKTVDLSGQGLTKVPNSVFNGRTTEVLNLSNNNLEGSLQAEVRNFSNLRVLNLSNNNFTGVPAEVGQLSRLEVLDLSNNPITGLPNEIGNLRNLKILDLRGTDYSSKDLEVIKQELSASVDILVD